MARSSILGGVSDRNGTASNKATRSGVALSAMARLAPTMPPPTMMTSSPASSVMRRAPAAGGSRRRLRRRHQGLDLGDGLGHAAGQHLVAILGDQHVVFDAHANVPPFFRHAFAAGGNVNARIAGVHHAGLQRPPLAADF